MEERGNNVATCLVCELAYVKSLQRKNDEVEREVEKNKKIEEM
jgi:hypothetical protein